MATVRTEERKGVPMDGRADRLKQLIIIHRVVQVFLLALLLYMAYHFQQLFLAKGMPQVFRNSIIAGLLVQFLLFFPLRKLAGREAEREVASLAPGLTPEARKGLRSQRILADMLKASVFLFFITFVLAAPPASFVLSTAFFSFVLTVLTYSYCLGFTLARLRR